MASPFVFLRERIMAQFAHAVRQSLRMLPRRSRRGANPFWRARWNPELVLPGRRTRFEAGHTFHARLRHADYSQSASAAGGFGRFLLPEITQVGRTRTRAHPPDSGDPYASLREGLNE